MKISKKAILTSVVLPLILSTGSAFVSANNGEKSPHECRTKLDRNILTELHLTEKQTKQLKTLRQSAKDEHKAQHDNTNPEQHKKMREQHFEQLNQLLLAETFNLKKAEQLVTEQSQRKIQRQVKKLQQQHSMLSLLTPKQKETFITLKKERLNECMKMMKKHKKK